MYGNHRRHAQTEETVSWFVAAGDFCTKMAATFFNTVVNAIPCVHCESDVTSMENARLRRPVIDIEENRDSVGLLTAAYMGNYAKSLELLTLPWININAQYPNGNTPLMEAIKGGHERLAHLLLQHPCINVNLRGLDGYTALILAASAEKQPNLMGLLLARPGTDVNLATYYGTTALTNAIRCGNEEAVHYLLMRRDIDINYQSQSGENALLEAVVYRRYDIAIALINRPDVAVDIVDSRDRTPLIMSVQYGYVPLVRVLLFAGCDPCAEDDHGRNALYYALKRPNCEMVHNLFEALSVPQSLMRMCRTVVRRQLRVNLGNGHRLKPSIERFHPHIVPKSVKRYLAYDP